ncbi:MAG: hypothetical protein GPJ54_09320 [Candidatus Heimdallarchaeota archaeon]|nr:hypothetical protein [Candidatus Heimdallarchaeota archaeon]
MMVQPSYSQSGSQQIHSRIELIINWTVVEIETDFVILRIFADVEIWNEDSTNQNLVISSDCTSKLATNIILVNSTLYGGIASECLNQAYVIEYTPGINNDIFSVDIIFTDPDLRTLPDGSYDIWLPVNGGKSFTAQINMTNGLNSISYQVIPEEWGANDNRPTPEAAIRNDQLDADDNLGLIDDENTLTSTLVVGNAIKYTFGFGLLIVTVGIIFFVRKKYRD